MISKYLTILEESLKMKQRALDQIIAICDKQGELLGAESFDLEAYDECVDQKDVCIDQINQIDEGFETLYQKIKEELGNHKEQYADQIKRIQTLITTVTEKSVNIQAKEKRNFDSANLILKNEKRKVGSGRRSSKAVLGYYKNLNQAISEGESAMDIKK